MYGLTEAFPIAVKGVADDGVPGSSGRPNPNFDVHIVGPDGAPKTFAKGSFSHF